MSPRKQNAGQPHCHFPYHTKRKKNSVLPVKEHFCFMAILTPIIMRKKAHFNTLVRHIGRRQGRRQGTVLCLLFREKQETQNRPLSPPASF